MQKFTVAVFSNDQVLLLDGKGHWKIHPIVKDVPSLLENPLPRKEN